MKNSYKVAENVFDHAIYEFSQRTPRSSTRGQSLAEVEEIEEFIEESEPSTSRGRKSVSASSVTKTAVEAKVTRASSLKEIPNFVTPVKKTGKLAPCEEPRRSKRYAAFPPKKTSYKYK